jgi:hypothetical protein
LELSWTFNVTFYSVVICFSYLISSAVFFHQIVGDPGCNIGKNMEWSTKTWTFFNLLNTSIIQLLGHLNFHQLHQKLNHLGLKNKFCAIFFVVRTLNYKKQLSTQLCY